MCTLSLLVVVVPYLSSTDSASWETFADRVYRVLYEFSPRSAVSRIDFSFSHLIHGLSICYGDRNSSYYTTKYVTWVGVFYGSTSWSGVVGRSSCSFRGISHKALCLTSSLAVV